MEALHSTSHLSAFRCNKASDTEGGEHLYTPYAHHCVQEGKVKRITANDRLLGSVDADAAHGDLLVDIHTSGWNWPWLVVRPCRDADTPKVVCCAWLDPQAACSAHKTECFSACLDTHDSSHSDSGNSMTGDDLSLHGECEVFLSPEDSLMMAAVVVESRALPRPGRIEQLAANNEYRYLSASVRLKKKCSCGQ